MLHAKGRVRPAGSAAHRGDRLRHGTGPLRGGSGDGTGEFAREAHRYRGTYNITDFRFFGLRDNNSAGPSFQQHFGLLRDDYGRKPAFGVYRCAIARYGARGR